MTAELYAENSRVNRLLSDVEQMRFVFFLNSYNKKIFKKFIYKNFQKVSQQNNIELKELYKFTNDQINILKFKKNYYPEKNI